MVERATKQKEITGGREDKWRTGVHVFISQAGSSVLEHGVQLEAASKETKYLFLLLAGALSFQDPTEQCLMHN